MTPDGGSPQRDKAYSSQGFELVELRTIPAWQRLSRPVVTGAVCGAVAAVPLALLLPWITGATSEPGATASSIDTGFSAIVGGGIAIALGAAIAAHLTRSSVRSRRFAQGLFAGYIGAAVSGIPFVVAVEGFAVLPIIGGLLLAAFGLTPFILVGAFLGTAGSTHKPLARASGH